MRPTSNVERRRSVGSPASPGPSEFGCFDYVDRCSFLTRYLWTFYDLRQARPRVSAACYFARVVVPASPRARTNAGLGIALIAAGGLAACTAPADATLQRLLDANKLAADLHVQFTKAGDGANRAVMADTDETSVAFAREAEQATLAVEKGSAALKPLLTSLRYSNELRLLDEFDMRFMEYRALDRDVLGLAVENTNLKAQRLSFGPAREAADAFANSLDAVTSVTPAETWRVRALAATATAAVREVQTLEAPHIAESDEAAMTRIEARMTAAAAVAREQLKTLAGLAAPASRGQLAAAAASLDRFVEFNAQLIALSRRNTNVRSLALSLGQKRMLAAACEDSLRALEDGLSKRGFSATR